MTIPEPTTDPFQVQKQCTKCLDVKDRSAFARRKNAADGLSAVCKTCRRVNNLHVKAPDLTGQTFGYWTVLSPDPKRKGNAYMLCRCRCGTEKVVQSSQLRSGESQSCRCRMKLLRFPMEGRTFRYWTVLYRDDTRRRPVSWICQCRCGTIKSVSGPQLRMLNGSQSCGCQADALTSQRLTKHGATMQQEKSSEYTAWGSIKGRCFNPNAKSFPLYGGRGITMAPEWKESFEQFLADMGPRPPGTSIERIDNNGHYEPGNCRWATQYEQTRNTSRNTWVTYDGRTQCLQDWANETGIAATTLWNRLQRGWTIGDALTKPPQHQAKSSK